MKQLVGLNTWLYTFQLSHYHIFQQMKERLESRGTITLVYVNNKWAFEFKPFKQI